MVVYKNVGDAVEGERVVCEYSGPRHLKPTKFSGPAGHREWRIKLFNAYCVIERKFRWLGDK